MDGEEIGIIATLAAIFLCLLIGLFCIIERAALPGDMAKIAQLRIDAASVGTASSEDVVGQVTAWNQRIASKKAYNSTWWACIVIPNQWDSMEPIAVRGQ